MNRSMFEELRRAPSLTIARWDTLGIVGITIILSGIVIVLDILELLQYADDFTLTWLFFWYTTLFASIVRSCWIGWQVDKRFYRQFASTDTASSSWRRIWAMTLRAALFRLRGWFVALGIAQLSLIVFIEIKSSVFAAWSSTRCRISEFPVRCLDLRSINDYLASDPFDTLVTRIQFIILFYAFAAGVIIVAAILGIAAGRLSRRLRRT
jgi:hypothetical protein